jgi:cation diffusion facilitator family transporter
MREPTVTEAEVETHTPREVALDRRSKQSAALVSAIAVVLLGLAKLGLGLATGSLGLVADAVHSGLDLVSTVLTFLAVRWADRPADADHPYGHGRAENLSGFVESLIILGTAMLIGLEAIRHIATGEATVIPTPLAFAVLLVSIGVSYWRSRALEQAAEAHGSDALAADALNFRADVWSSLVVLVGLALVVVGQAFDIPELASTADAVAGLIVALLVIAAAARLARETIDALLDRSPEDIAEQMAEAVARVPEVVECRRVRLRRVGGRYFVDVIAVAPRTETFQESHALTEQIERAIWRVEPRSDIVVHLEPTVTTTETILDRIYLIAQELGVRVHDVQVRSIDGKSEVNLHVEVSPDLSLDRAHALASRLEDEIAASNPDVAAVNTHLEVAPPVGASRTEVTSQEAGLVRRITAVASDVLGPGRCYDVRLYRPSERRRQFDVVLRCSFSPTASVATAHEQAERVEQVLRARLPDLGSVLVHVEPRGEEGSRGNGGEAAR